MTRPEPFPHQVEANNKLNPLKECALLSDMGTGKTRIAIDWFQSKESNKIVIIAPLIVAQQWVNEQLPEHCCNVHYKAHAFQSKHTKKYMRKLDSFMMSARYSEDLHILCIHYEAFVNDVGLSVINQFLSTSEKQPIFIIDESSRIKNPDAKSVKNIIKIRQQFPDACRMIMSGSPASKSPVDLWSQFEFLIKRYFGVSYPVFNSIHAVKRQQKLRVKGRLMSIEMNLDKDTYDKIKKIIDINTKDGKLHPDVPAMVQHKFGVNKDDFEFVRSSKRFQRFKNLDQLQKKIAPITYAVKREDCLKLPDKIYERIKCPLNAQQKKLIKELIKYSATVYEDKMLTVEVKALIGLRVLQICGGNFSHLTDMQGKFDSQPIKGVNHKLHYLVNDIPELGDQQFVVCAVYTAEIEAIEKALQKITSVGVLYGATHQNYRELVVDEFKNGNVQGLIMNPAVGGFGLNLQNATVQYWYSRNYRTEVRLQTEDRQHRIGTKVSPIYKDLISEIKFEQDVLDVLQEGKEVNDVFVNKSINEIFKI